MDLTSTTWPFLIDRFDTPSLHDRTYYAGRFEAVETAIARFAAAVHGLAASGDLSSQGLWARLQAPKSDAYGSAQQALNDIGAALGADHEAITEVLDAPEPPPSTEVGLALAYAQALALRTYDGDGDDPDLLTELAEAIDDSDAITAQVLADLAPAIVRPTGAGDITTSRRLQRLTQQAVRLRTVPAKRAALVLQDLLDGTDDEPGVDQRHKVAAALLGPRLELIEADGEDRLVRAFSLDYPVPSVLANPLTFMGGITPQRLRQYYGLMYGSQPLGRV